MGLVFIFYLCKRDILIKFYTLKFFFLFLSDSSERKQRDDQRGRGDCRWHIISVLSSPVSPLNILLAQNIPIFLCRQEPAPASLETPPLQTLVSAIIVVNLPLRNCAPRYLRQLVWTRLFLLSSQNSGMFSPFYALFNVLRYCGSNSGESCSQNRSPAYASVFSVSRLKSTTVFLFAFFGSFLSFFFLKRKRERNERIKKKF